MGIMAVIVRLRRELAPTSEFKVRSDVRPSSAEGSYEVGSPDLYGCLMPHKQTVSVSTTRANQKCNAYALRKSLRNT